jgi:O-antigen/teichoic acid export membrane protein
MIPFLLSDGMLGVAGFGQVATLLALFALLLIVTDGVRVSQTRTIAHSIDTEPENGKIVGSCAQIITIVSLPISLIIFSFAGCISDLAGLPWSSQMILAVMIIGVI